VELKDKMKRYFFLYLILIMLSSFPAYAIWSNGNAPYINTWLVLGTFDNGKDDAGFKNDYIDENNIHPEIGHVVLDKTWEYFDDRYFSRNYDDYEDLFSYFKYIKKESIDSKVAYAATYVYSAKNTNAQLRYSGDSRIKAYFNGKLLNENICQNAYKDDVICDVSINKGWNLILLKVANNQESFFGFYARISDKNGNEINGLTYSINNTQNLSITTKNIINGSNNLPSAYREWPYIELKVPYLEDEIKRWPENAEKIRNAAQATGFTLTSSGGTPSYTWSVAKGKLPKGITLLPSGTFTGRVSVLADLGDYKFTVSCKDISGKVVSKDFVITLKERPNKWFEDSKLTGLVHAPEEIPEKDYAVFAKLLKDQGYQSVFPISYGNGTSPFMFKTRFNDSSSKPEVIGNLKKTLEAEGIKLNMYIGEMQGMHENKFTYNQSVLMLEDAIVNYSPKAFWFDWLGISRPSKDALYSAIRTLDPNIVLVLNGIGKPWVGDWDILSIEDFSYGNYDKIWENWPGTKGPIAFADYNPEVYDWPKRYALETWRMISNPKSDKYGDGPWNSIASKQNVDWEDILRLQISLIGDGNIANMDHSVGIGLPAGVIKDINDVPIVKAHEKMAKWANYDNDKKYVEPLYLSYTNVNKAPLKEANWGYSTINLEINIIYLHFMKNKRGKTGLSNLKEVSLNGIKSKVKKVSFMNKVVDLPFNQKNDNLVINLSNVYQDNVDSIVKIVLDKSIPVTDDAKVYPNNSKLDLQKSKPGNIAFKKPSKLLSIDGLAELVPSTLILYASKGNDGEIDSMAAGGGNWNWRYQIDLKNIYSVDKINVYFGENGFSTSYEVLVSTDSVNWQLVYKDENNKDGGWKNIKLANPVKARYLRIDSLKPNGPGQFGGQMCVAEFEAYGKLISKPKSVSNKHNPALSNVALNKPAKLMSNDFVNLLTPSGEILYAKNAVDGDINTMAVASGQYPWNLYVDLEKSYSVSEIVINFAKDNFATNYKVFVSNDNKAWSPIITDDKNKAGGRKEFFFDAINLRYIRVVAYYPNGANQLGGQMGIAELEVYGK